MITQKKKRKKKKCIRKYNHCTGTIIAQEVVLVAMEQRHELTEFHSVKDTRGTMTTQPHTVGEQDIQLSNNVSLYLLKYWSQDLSVTRILNMTHISHQTLHGVVSYLVSERDYPRQQADEDVCVHTPLMGFIYDYHTVLLEQEILWDETATELRQHKE